MKKLGFLMKAMCVIAVAVFFFAFAAGTAQAWTDRPLSDFLDAQGTSSTFFPPVKDYVGWVDGEFITFALVDYAGLADKYIKQKTGDSLGTEVRGIVTEKPADDGKAQVKVVLSTTNALGFAQSIEDLEANDWDFLNTPTIFGAKAQDVVKEGAEPVVGQAILLTTFTISEPGADLPDLVDVIFDNPGDYAPVKVSFKFTTVERRPDGTKARLKVHQVGYFDEAWDWSKEKVEIVNIDDDDDDDND